MSRDEIDAAVRQLLTEQFGTDDYPVGSTAAKSLQEALGCTSLDVVSVQLACEERFGLEFADGMHDRGQVDLEWDGLKSVDGLVDLVEKWIKET